MFTNENNCGILISYTYNENGTPQAFTVNDEFFYYLTNAMGDVIGFTDANGKLINLQLYDVWGTRMTQWIGQYKYDGQSGWLQARRIANLNPLLYRGYYRDAETEFYYLQSRYYSPMLSRFLNADDPEIALKSKTDTAGMNLFAYCNNDPANNVDPTGFKSNSKTKYTYVFYYNGKSSLKTQAVKSCYFDSKSKKVKMKEVNTVSAFINAWNTMENAKDVYLYLHGGIGCLYFEKSMKMKGNNSLTDLKKKSISGKIYLFSCHGGDGIEGNNVAWYLSKKNNVKVVAALSGVSYSKEFGYYYARIEKEYYFSISDYGYWWTFYYEKKYVLWGSKVAKRRTDYTKCAK